MKLILFAISFSAISVAASELTNENLYNSYLGQQEACMRVENHENFNDLTLTDTIFVLNTLGVSFMNSLPYGPDQAQKEIDPAEFNRVHENTYKCYQLYKSLEN